MAGPIGTVAFSGAIAAVPLALGTSDLESYENAFFSLDRGTAVHAVRVLGHPVYTLAIGLGVRLPLHANLGASPAAYLAPYLPAPLTYWLLIACAIAMAVFVVRHALEPVCGRVVSSLAVLLLFCSAPVVNYTISEDLPHIAVTYCAFVGSVFAPHAILASFRTGTSRARHLRVLGLVAVMGGLIAGSHPGYWPLLAGTLVLAAMLALCRVDYRLRDRIASVATLGAVSLMAVAPLIPDMIREVRVAGAAAADMPRVLDGPMGDLAANLFPFGDLDNRLPFVNLVMALIALAVGLASKGALTRAVMIGSAVLAMLLGIGAAAVSPAQLVYAPSNMWALRDPALVFAVLSGALAAAAALTRQANPARAWPRAAAAALTLAALQGPAYAVALVHRGSPEWTPNPMAWNRDMTPPDTRVSMRGLPRDRVPPGERLALWPGESARMRFAKHATVDFADAGYLLVTAWTKQRTMRNLVQPNEELFNQSVELAPAVLCDARAVQFLRLRYLLTPPGVQCEPWRVVPALHVDGQLEVRVAADGDTRVRALPVASLSEPLARSPALSSDGSALMPALRPVAGTSLHLGSDSATIQIQFEDPSASLNQALVLPVAYDRAWRPSSGQTRDVAGLLAVIGVDQRRVTLDFVPDAVALLRAVSTTLVQLLAAAGLLGLTLIRPASSTDAALVAFDSRVGTRASLAIRRLESPTRLHLVYAAAVMLALRWTPRDADDTGLLTALLLPVSALVVARLSRSAWWHGGIGGTLLALVFFRTVSVGSVSPSALHDPPFWALLTLVALGTAAATRRWPAAAACAATVAGACAITAALASVVPGVDPGVQLGYVDMIRESLATLSNQIGVVALIALAGAWLHAMFAVDRPPTADFGIGAMARGALFVALLFSLAGVVPTSNGLDPVWVVALGMLLGLADARPLRHGRQTAAP